MSLKTARLDSRALIRVTGPDARPFLHNILTQNVETLAPGELRCGALLSPPGRVLFDLFIWGEEEGVVLDVAAERRAALMQRLALYRMRSKAEIIESPDAVFASWDGEAAGFAPDPRLSAMGGRRYGDETEVNALEADHDAHRLSLGLPDPARDAVPDKVYPIEANFDLLNGIDFHKGCFIGQETTSRLKRLGVVKNRMLPITYHGPAPAFGAEVRNGELRAGEVMSGSDGRAIALLRLDRLDGALSVEDRAVTVEKPDWIV